MSQVYREIPMYRVWDPLNQDEQTAADKGWDYGALDIAAAAQVHASYRYIPDEMNRRNWPLTFRVRELATGLEYDVAVALDWQPRFIPATPVPVKGTK